jgi:hypothetical protein
MRTALVSTLRTVTVAPGTTAPLVVTVRSPYEPVAIIEPTSG